MNPIRCGEGKPLEVNLIHLEKGTPWIGGDPQEANPIRFGGYSPEANPIRRGEGESLEVNFIHLEKEKGTPLKRIPFAVERGGGGNPLGRIPSTWRRGPLGQGVALYEANSIRIGEGDPHEANPLLRRGGSP